MISSPSVRKYATSSSLKKYFPGKDDQESIKHAVLFAYENLSTKYLMLGGDAHMFPVRYRFVHDISKNYDKNPANIPNAHVPTDGDYVPSDNYYVNLYHHGGTYPSMTKGPFDDWDANGNGLYNEGTWVDMNSLTKTNPDNVDGYPDLAVGRVPAHTVADRLFDVNLDRSAVEKGHVLRPRQAGQNLQARVLRRIQ